MRLSTLIVCTPPKTRPRHLRGGLDNVSDMLVLHAMEATFLSEPPGRLVRARAISTSTQHARRHSDPPTQLCIKYHIALGDTNSVQGTYLPLHKPPNLTIQ